jgi:hypothetical protein
MAKQIYYLLAYDFDAKRWTNADHVLGLLTEGPLYTAEQDDEAGEWSQIEDPELIDLDFDNAELIGKFLKQANE